MSVDLEKSACLKMLDAEREAPVGVILAAWARRAAAGDGDTSMSLFRSLPMLDWPPNLFA